MSVYFSYVIFVLNFPFGSRGSDEVVCRPCSLYERLYSILSTDDTIRELVMGFIKKKKI